MLIIRLQRIGKRNDPSFRVVAVDSKLSAKKGKPVELLGTHDRVRNVTKLNDDRIKYWISKGAQVSDSMNNLLIVNGVIEGVKKNVLPKKTPIIKEQPKEEEIKAEATSTEKSTEETSQEQNTETEKVAPAETSKEEQAVEKKPEEVEETSQEQNTETEKVAPAETSKEEQTVEKKPEEVEEKSQVENKKSEETTDETIKTPSEEG